jgi:hypothetical protein
LTIATCSLPAATFLLLPSHRYSTKDGTAYATHDYVPVTGELIFEKNEISKTFEVKLIESSKFEKNETFSIMLSDATDGACFDSRTVGGKEGAECKITISESALLRNMLFGSVLKATMVNKDRLALNVGHWSEQFSDAVTVFGGEDENGEPIAPGCSTYIMHYLSMPWKLLFCVVPPVTMGGGWPCFGIALGMIGAVTVIIGDLAGVLGCVIGLEDSITAITFVALGTSLPDTFASKSAAVNDATADASIGNVTGMCGAGSHSMSHFQIIFTFAHPHY